MDFTKFTDLILNSRLYFRRIDAFEDPYEGYISKEYRECLHSQYEIMQSKLSLTDKNRNDLYSTHIDGVCLIPTYSYANCWYIGEIESAAMWKLYGGNSDCIAICSSFDSLARTLEESNEAFKNGTLHLNKIRYVKDFSSQNSENLLQHMFEKRESFSHEREFRALIVLDEGLKMLASDTLKPSIELAKEQNEVGFYMDVNVLELVNSIHISPTSSPLFCELVEQLMKLKDLDGIEFMKSELYNLK